MYLLGHLGAGMLVFAPLAYHLCQTGRGRRASVGTVTVLLLAVVPDADTYVPGLVHRGVTHTVWMALLLGALLALLGWRLHAGPGRASATRFGFLVGASSVLSHLLADMLTPMGIRPFAPLAGGEYTLAIVPSADPGANLFLLVAGGVSLTPSLGRTWVRAGCPLPAWPTWSPVERLDVVRPGNDPADPVEE